MSIAGGALIISLIVDHEAVRVGGLQAGGDLVQVAFVESPVEIGGRFLQRRHAVIERLECHLEVGLRVAGGDGHLIGELRVPVP